MYFIYCLETKSSGDRIVVESGCLGKCCIEYQPLLSDLAISGSSPETSIAPEGAALD
jgi:hypothetical protein